MIEAHMRVVPEGQSAAKKMESIRNALDEKFSEYDESCEGYVVRLVTPETFNEDWQTQETYKNDVPAITEKYRGLAADGRLVYVEIDY